MLDVCALTCATPAGAGPGPTRDPVARERRERALAVIGPGPFARALALGSDADGLVERLTTRCGELVAHERMSAHELPVGPFDLIVVTELLRAWSAIELEAALPRLEAALAPRGRLVAVHARDAGQGLLDGDRVHTQLRERSSLVHAVGWIGRTYRIDRFDRLAG